MQLEVVGFIIVWNYSLDITTDWESTSTRGYADYIELYHLYCVSSIRIYAVYAYPISSENCNEEKWKHKYYVLYLIMTKDMFDMEINFGNTYKATYKKIYMAWTM